MTQCLTEAKDSLAFAAFVTKRPIVTLITAAAPAATPAHLPDRPIEDSTEQHADRALLTDIVKTLTPQQRSVVVLRHWEQMSTDETATALGMAPGAVKCTLHRALARLRQELQHRAPPTRLQRLLPAV